VFARIEYESEEGEAFMEKYQVRGFPTVLILDAEGNKLMQLPLTFSPTAFVDMIARS
jgi:thioredoxin-related protein